MIEGMAATGVEVAGLFGRFESEADASVKRAILLTLGQFGADRLSAAERQTRMSWLLTIYRDDADAGIHGAAEWLLRQWGAAGKLEEADREAASRGALVAGGKRWYMNKHGHTMAIIDRPGEFCMGEGNDRHKQRIDRAYAIASKEVTRKQFWQFFKTQPDAPIDGGPANGVTWYEAVEYCNRLSQEEGIPKDQWCYLPNDKGNYAEGMRPASNFLELAGYRLPAEAEWEYACRAGSTTGWCFGDAMELVDKYAWNYHNSLQKMHASAQLKPNELGLFDMHGNAWEWCHDVYKDLQQLADDGQTLSDNSDRAAVKNQERRVQRGGSFNVDPMLVRSSVRSGYVPVGRMYRIGFRPARTVR